MCITLTPPKVTASPLAWFRKGQEVEADLFDRQEADLKSWLAYCIARFDCLQVENGTQILIVSPSIHSSGQPFQLSHFTISDGSPLAWSDVQFGIDFDRTREAIQDLADLIRHGATVTAI